MKFEVGDLIRFVWSDFRSENGRIIFPVSVTANRGNNIGVIIGSREPLFDSRLYYTYKVHYQNGFISWEVEEHLFYLRDFPRNSKYLKNN